MPSLEIERPLSLLLASGVEILIEKADVTSRADIARVLDIVRRTMPPLRGVIHAAMVLDDALLIQLDESRMWKVMDPKANGAWNLHALTLNDPLKLFVMFSSFSGVLGAPGQGNYAAANVFLDALASYRRARGLPGLTVDWGAVGGVGYVAENSRGIRKTEQLGVRALPPEVLLDILGNLIQRGAIQTGVCGQDWQRVSKLRLVGNSARFDNLLAGASEGGNDPSGAQLLDALMAVDPKDRQSYLETQIKNSWPGPGHFAVQNRSGEAIA